jgi:hypothetical protein
MVFRISWCREDPDDTAAATGVLAKKLPPNVSTRSGLLQAPTFPLGVLNRLPDVLVGVFVHRSSIVRSIIQDAPVCCECRL